MPTSTPSRRTAGLAGAALGLLAGGAPAPAAAPTLDGGPALVIAHRGASGYRPEHTLAAYELAVRMGADYVEPDLVATKDGRLVARHEPEIGATTDVAAKFPGRRTTETVDGVATEGWFAADFTLAEIKTLRARMPQPFRADAWDGLYEVPTLEEVIALAKRLGAEAGRPVGIYPETKHPSWHNARGLSLEEPLVAALAAAGWTGPDAPVFVQSFEVANLKELAGRTGVRLVQLLGDPDARPHDLALAGDPRTYRDLMRPEGLRAIAGYARGVGAPKRAIAGADPDGTLRPPSALIADAHAAGLAVHAYTFRDEPRFLPPAHAPDPAAEVRGFLDLGVDGVFTDFPDTAARARAAAAPR